LPEIFEIEGDKETFYLTKNVLKAEIPSFNMASNARTLAKLGAFMANKGEFEGKTLISRETWDCIHSEPK
jgi:hypothetical protein